MQLDDEYIEGKGENGVRKTTPKKGWEGNIMGEFWGTVDERNINDILRKNKVKNIVKKTDDAKLILNTREIYD